jgi:hypothetical protein
MKKFITILGAILVSSICFAQQLKTYSGEYDINSNEVDVLTIPANYLKGTASYTYFEDENLNRIRSGNFTYNGKLSRNGSLVTVSISGKYDKNKKNDNWNVEQTISGSGVSVVFNFNGTYKEGLPNGLWTSKQTLIQNGKTGGFTISMTFTNNIINGEFKITPVGEATESITGNLDKNGYFTGKTIVKKGGDEYQLTFDNGLLISSIGRNLQSGNVFNNFKINEEQLAIFNQLLVEKDSSIIENIPYRIAVGYGGLADELVIKQFYKQFKEASLFDLTPGDLSIDEHGKYNWIGFEQRVLEKSETKTEKLAKLKVEEENLKRLEDEKLEGKLKEQYEEKIKRINAYHLSTNGQGQLVINIFARPSLYDAFKILYDHYSSLWKLENRGENSIDKRLGHVKKIDMLCDKVLIIHGIDKKVFKEQYEKLKNEKSIEVLEKILELDKQN